MYKIIKCDNFEFEVDYKKNLNYYSSNKLCDCIPDENFYNLIEIIYPKLVEFLAGFGVNAARPDEVSWVEQDTDEQTVFYEAMYSVNGVVKKGELSVYGKAKVSVDGLDVYFNKCDFPNGQNGKCFGISVFVVLPWNQNEPYDDYFYQGKSKKSLFKRFFKNKGSR